MAADGPSFDRADLTLQKTTNHELTIAEERVLHILEPLVR
jgi:hypothetical protein